MDKEEVGKFEAMANQWWDPFGPFMPLQQMNPRRVEFIRRNIERDRNINASDALPFRGLHLLDIGCGGGILAESLARLGAQVLAIDASDDNVNAARAHATRDPSLDTRLEYQAITAEYLADQHRQFDAVVASEILEHVNRPTDFLATCVSLIKPGGSLFITTINRTPLAYLKTVLAAEHLLRWVPVGTHDYSKYVRPEELESALHKAGTVVVDKQGAYFDPLSRQWHFTDHLNTNYFMAAKKLLDQDS